MVDLERLLRERGAEVDATWDPVTAFEVFATADQIENRAAFTPSLRARVRRWHPMTVALAAGAVALLLFLPILLLIASQEVADNTPPSTVSPPTTSADATGGLVLYTNAEDGYEVMLPKSWVAGATGADGSYTEPSNSSESYQGVRRFGTVLNGNSDRSALTISIGEPDGSVHSCVGLRIRTCYEASLDDIEQMREFLASKEQAFCSGSGTPGGSLIESETVLGDDTAQVMWLDSIDGRCRAQMGGGVMVWGSALGSHHIIYSILDGRPVILAFDRTTVDTLAFRSDLAAILESFRFLEPEAEPEENPGDLVLYTNTEDGYELLLPRPWVASTMGPDGTYREPDGLWGVFHERGDDPYPGVRRFGSGPGGHDYPPAMSLYPALTISVGAPDGSVISCQTHKFGECESVTLGSLDEMGEFLVSTPWTPCGATAEPTEEATLGGIDARIERYGGGACGLGTTFAMYHVFAIHDGRPVILAFDQWTDERTRIAEMIESFRFLEPTPSS